VDGLSFSLMEMIKMKTRAKAGFATDGSRWKAILFRDPDADGEFFFSVKTTGVYCRPSCAARRPRRENVQFHDSPEDVARAGFRACKRCRPNGPSIDQESASTIAAACRTIDSCDELPSLAVLARAARMSPFHFHRLFKKFTGLTPRSYAMARRAERLRGDLPKRRTVTEAIYDAGFNSSGRFYAESSRMLGMAPKDFRNGGAGEVIRFALGECSLGSILVASSEKGICAISLGDDPDTLAREFQDSFANAQLIGGNKKFERLVARVIGMVEAPNPGWSLPLDVRGTVFQRRVWRALCRIQSGCTASYTEIAKRIGSPKSIRAVASACAANVIAVAIPCHRVVRNDGGLSGYRWGVERKRALLEKERSDNGALRLQPLR